MQGKRIYPPSYEDLKPSEINPGEYWLDEKMGWLCCTPNGQLGTLIKHLVTEHDDGTITVAPSILVSGGDTETYHGFLEHGVWREV
jgi:hypothetical protein